MQSEIIKIITGSLATGIVGYLIYLIKKINKKYDDMATKNEVESSLKEAKTYTDKAIIDHEKVHSEIKVQYQQIQSDLTLIKNHLMGGR